MMATVPIQLLCRRGPAGQLYQPFDCRFSQLRAVAFAEAGLELGDCGGGPIGGSADYLLRQSPIERRSIVERNHSAGALRRRGLNFTKFIGTGITGITGPGRRRWLDLLVLLFWGRPIGGSPRPDFIPARDGERPIIE